MKLSISPRSPVLLRKILVWLMLLCGLVLYLSFGYQQPAIGAVIQEQISPTLVLYKAQQTLRDPTGYSWQVIVFKEIKNGQPSDTTLRLVGYPDAVEFVHPQTLTMKTNNGKVLNLADVFAKTSPAPNVGQYNLSDILPDLPSDFVTLFIPLKKGAVKLRIPPFVVEDWQKIATSKQI